MDKAKAKDQAIETRIYQRLRDHPCICKYIREEKDGIILERLGETLRKYLQRLLRNGQTVGFDQAVEWSGQAAEGLAYLHSKEILQGDIGCHNLLLDQHNNLKFCDFAGSSIDGEDPTVCCDVRYQPHTDDLNYPVTVRTEIFGLGYILYEKWTGSMPYQDASDEDVNEHFRNFQFPDVQNLPPASVISKCWHGSFSNVAEIVKDLAHLRAQPLRMKANSEAGTRSSSQLKWLHTEHLRHIAILSATFLATWFLTRRLSK